MQATCSTCGTPYEAKRRTSKFCSDHCRIRAHRAPRATEVPAAAAPAPEAARAAEPAVPPQPAGSGLEAATEQELRTAGRLDTALGQAAIILARMLDSPGTDTGSSVAALVREHRATLAAATANAETAADPLDELANRRQKRRVAPA